MQKYLYLLIDLLSIGIPFALSFDSKINFSKKWKYLWPAIIIPAIPFLVWDQWFVNLGVWGFNTQYLTGLHVLDLPVEEILFFICVPYACVFTYEAVNYFSSAPPLPANGERVTWVLMLGLVAIGIKNYDRWYPIVTCMTLAAFLLFLQLKLKPPFLGKFYFAFLFILIPFFGVNSVLTGSFINRPVVWYNNSETIGIRIGTIPIEDTFYGMLLILINVTIFEYFQNRSKPT